MMQKRTIYSLLLTSFILVCAFSLSSAQSVVVEDVETARCVLSGLDVTVDPGTDVSAFEIILEVTSGGAYFTTLDFEWDAGFLVLTNRIVNITGPHNDGTPDTIRVAGMLIDNGDACLGASTVVGQVKFTTNNSCDGTVELAGISLDIPTLCGCDLYAENQFVDCATTTLIPAAVTAGTVTVVNQKPTIDPIAGATVHWGLLYQGLATGSDPDEASCEDLDFSKLSGPAALTVEPDGDIFWTTTGADVGNNTVEVLITDDCGAQDTTSFVICVENTPPEITCPEETFNLIWGYEVSGGVVGFDDDGGPLSLVYSVASFDGPGTPTVNPVTGDWAWQTLEDNAYLGLFELCITVTDGANTDECSPENADTCCVYLYVVPTIRATIEKTHGSLQGQTEEVSIYIDSLIDPPNEMGGFDFLIYYDYTALTFQSAVPGQLLVDCGWEYFTYRQGPDGNCGPNACPSGFLRIVALAETNNGANHPACFSGAAGQLVSLEFMVTNDYTFNCMYVPIRWTWYDCGDNTISSKSGDTLFISRHVYDYDNTTPVEDLGAAFPTYFGAPAVCDTYDKAFPLRLVDFQNGGVDIICVDSIDGRGDINLNGLDNEIADAVLYTNYFIYGIGVFSNVPAQTAASDVNADGIALTVGDLVYQIRIIIGDVSPYPKAVSPVAVDMVNRDGNLEIANNVQIGGAYVVVEGNVAPQLLADEMEMSYNYDGINTRILVYSFQGNSFAGQFLNVDGRVVSMELATRDGYPVNVDMLPTNFVLNQNYPNPFNPTTTISFEIPTATDWNLDIYNVNGQIVHQTSGYTEAGLVTETWDASNLGSGVFFYRLTAGDFSDVKKMVLVK
jgi:type IX secretion system substrate protein